MSSEKLWDEGLFCSECGSFNKNWHDRCPTCGLSYILSTELPSTVEDEPKQQDFEQPLITSYPSGIGARSSIPDRSPTPTESLTHSHEDSQPPSHDRTDITQKVPHTISPEQKSSKQDGYRPEEGKTTDGPSNSLSCLSPADGSSITRADNEAASNFDASSRRFIVSSSKVDEYPCSACDNIFTGRFGRGNLRRHFLLRHGSNSKSYTCREPNCNKSYRRSDARRTHEYQSHPRLTNRSPVPGTKPVYHGQDARDVESLLESSSSKITSRNIDSLGFHTSQPTDASVRTDPGFEGHSNNDRSVLFDSSLPSWTARTYPRPSVTSVAPATLEPLHHARSRLLGTWELSPNTGFWSRIDESYSERQPSLLRDEGIALDEISSRMNPLPRTNDPPDISHMKPLSGHDLPPNNKASRVSIAQAHHDLVEDMNDEWDNLSVRSIESSATLVSTLSGYTSVEMESATTELRRVLQEDPNLAKLYRLAIEDAKIGPERLQRNLGRLLKQMAHDLNVEANKELERLTSRFVAVKARNMAHCIVQDLRVTRRPQQSIERSEESESEHEDTLVDENPFEDLTIFRTFLVESDAFQTFQSRLAAFVHSKCLPEIETKIEIEGTDTNHWSSRSLLPFGWLSSIYISIIFATGFVEQQITSHAVRLKWNCVSHLIISIQT
jgi:hypothetical protein